MLLRDLPLPSCLTEAFVIYAPGLAIPVPSSNFAIALDHLSKAVLSVKSSSLSTVIVQSSKVLSPATLRVLPLNGTLTTGTDDPGI